MKERRGGGDAGSDAIKRDLEQRASGAGQDVARGKMSEGLLCKL